MTPSPTDLWQQAASDAGWTGLNGLMDALEALVLKLDGPHANPFVYCAECETPLLDGHYQAFCSADLGITKESWSLEEAGKHFCRDRNHVRTPRGRLVAVPVNTVKRRRA